METVGIISGLAKVAFIMLAECGIVFCSVAKGPRYTKTICSEKLSNDYYSKNLRSCDVIIAHLNPEP